MVTVPSPSLVSYQSAVAAFRAGTDTPRDFLERALDRLDQWEPELRAFAALAIARARLAADAATTRWRTGSRRSPIDGMPVGIKDVIDTFDLPTGAGSVAFEGFRPRHDSAAVHALRQAGAAVVGKTATTELALTHPAATRNPHDLARTPGGSSSGSAAAVGAGILPAAIGTQAIGSILRPASFCGAYGFKPTYGAINRGGTRDFHSQSCLGVLGADLRDVWYTLQAMASAGGDPGQPGLTGGPDLPTPARPSVAVLLETEGWSDVSDEVHKQLEVFTSRLAKAGVTVRHHRTDDEVAALEKALGGALDKARHLINHESRWLVDALAAQDRTALSDAVVARIDGVRHVTPDDYRALLHWRDDLRSTFDTVMQEADVAITLSAPGAAPRGLTGTGNAALTVPSSLLGAPAASLPIFADEGLPVGLQLIGPRHHDEQLFAVAQWAADIKN